MKKYDILKKIVQVTAIAVLAFGGALLHTGPPFFGYTSYLQSNSGYVQYDPPDWGDRLSPDFAATFGTLVILTVIQVIARKYTARLTRATWFILGALCMVFFACNCINYSGHKSKWTIGLPPEHPTEYQVVGDTLTRYGLELKNNLTKQGHAADDAHLVSPKSAAWSITQIWTRASIDKRSQKLVDEYTLVMALLSAAVFLFAEGVFCRPRTKEPETLTP